MITKKATDNKMAAGKRILAKKLAPTKHHRTKAKIKDRALQPAKLLSSSVILATFFLVSEVYFASWLS